MDKRGIENLHEKNNIYIGIASFIVHIQCSFGRRQQ